MSEDKNETNDFELYTETVVQSPKRKYKKLLLGIRTCVVILLACIIAFIICRITWPIIKQKIKEKTTEIIYIEKDDYKEYKDDQYSEDITDGVGDDYDNAMRNIKSKVDVCTKSIITVDYENTDIESELNDSDSYRMPAVIVGNINSEYIVLTNSAIKDNNKQNKKIVAKFNDGSEAALKYVGSYDELGFSLYKFSASDVSTDTKKSIAIADLGNSYLIGQGDMLIVAGKMHGEVSSVNYCTVSGLNISYQTDNGYEIIETNLTKDRDDYSFLYNDSGALVGIYFKSPDSTIKAIGVSDLKGILQEMINKHGYLYCGITAQNITKDLSAKYNLPMGVYIMSVDVGSPAYMAGLQAGDLITKVDNESVLTIQLFSEKLYQKSDGETMRLTVNRKDKEGYSQLNFDVNVKLIQNIWY